MRRAMAAALCVLAVGCGNLTHNDYVEARASAECKKIAVCHTGFFDSEYRDHDDCVKEFGNVLDDLEDTVFNDCDYDGDEARRCTSRVNGMGCEDYAEGDASRACDQVWNCYDL